MCFRVKSMLGENMSEAQDVKDLISSLEIGEPVRFKNMTVFPLNTPKRGMPYVLLSEAIEHGMIEAGEVSGEGSVPVVRVRNRGSKPVLMTDGEELVGCKQDRILNATVLVGPNSTIDIPVSCVERGRWRYESGGFRRGVITHLSLRRMKAQQVGESLRMEGTHDSDQSAVWREVDRLHCVRDVGSPTDSLHDVFEAERTRLEDYVRAFRVNAKGMAVCINGKVTVCEVFDKKSTLKRMLPRLIRSAAMDALSCQDEVYVEAEESDVERFLKRTLKANVTEHDSPGLGEDVRIKGRGIEGAGLVHKGKVLHLELFRVRTEPPRRTRTRRTWRDSYAMGLGATQREEQRGDSETS